MKKLLKIILILAVVMLAILLFTKDKAEVEILLEDEIVQQEETEVLSQNDIVQVSVQDYFSWNVDVMGISVDLPESYKPQTPLGNIKLNHYVPEEDYFAFSFLNQFIHTNGKDSITLSVNNHPFASMGEDPPYDDELGDQVMANSNGVKYSLKLFKGCDYDGNSCQYYDHYKIKLHENAYSNTITLSIWKGPDNNGGYTDLDIEKVLESIKIFEPIVTENNIHEITQEL